MSAVPELKAQTAQQWHRLTDSISVTKVGKFTTHFIFTVKLQFTSFLDWQLCYSLVMVLCLLKAIFYRVCLVPGPGRNIWLEELMNGLLIH